MSEPTGDTPPPHSHPPADPSATGAEPTPLSVAPRANPTSVFNPKDATAPTPPPPGAPAGFNEFMTWMQAFGSAQSAPPPAVDAPAGRQTLAKEQKKFHRQGQESAKAERPSAPSAARPAGTAAGESGSAGLTDPPRPPVPVIRKRRPLGTNFEPPQRSYAWLIPWIILAALLLGSFLLGRVTAPRPAPVSAAVAEAHTAADRGEVNPQTLDVINQAMAAEANRDFDRAASLLQQARREPNHIPGLDYHMALVAFEKGDPPHAMSLLDQSISEGEEMAASYNLRGTLANRQGGINHGLPGLQTATQLDPFNAKYFFFYGEALRRAGKPQAALTALQQAIDRLREPALEGLYRLKLRLTLLELGREKEFANELAGQLQKSAPSLDWLCTAAAVEMHAGRFDAAAGYLDRAQALPERLPFETRLRDFFFYGFAHEKALARFYAAVAPNPVAPAPAASPFGEIAPPPPMTLLPDRGVPSPAPSAAPQP